MAKCRLFQYTKFLSSARYRYNSTAVAVTVSLYNINAILREFSLKYVIIYVKINLTSQGISVSHDPHFT